MQIMVVFSFRNHTFPVLQISAFWCFANYSFFSVYKVQFFDFCGAGSQQVIKSEFGMNYQ